MVSKDMSMVEQKNWRDLLYPGEWGFRFFVGALVVWLVGQELREPIAAVVFYALTLGVLGMSVMQVWVLVKSARQRGEDDTVRH